MPDIALLFLAGFTLTSGLLGANDASLAPRNSAILECPVEPGLCRISSDGSWEPFWTDTYARTLVQFQQGPSGHVVVLLRGHQADGELRVLDPSGKLVFRRLLGAARPLEELTGWQADGTPLLCNAISKLVFCDVALGDGEPPGALSTVLEGCGYPRLAPDREHRCFVSGPALTEISVREGGWLRRDLRVPRRRMHRDIQVTDSGDVLVFDAPNLFRFAPGQTLPAEEVDRVSSTWLSRGSFYWARCAVADGATSRGPCTLHREAKHGKPAYSWELPGDHLTPAAVQETSGDSVMVDLRNHQERVIIEMSESHDRSRVIWSRRGIK